MNALDFIGKLVNHIKRSFKEWIIEMFDENPFKCTKCGDDMILWEIWHHKYGTIYDVLDKSNYRNIIDDDIDKNQELKADIKYIDEQMELF